MKTRFFTTFCTNICTRKNLFAAGAFVVFVGTGMAFSARDVTPSHDVIPIIDYPTPAPDLGHVAPAKILALTWKKPDLERMKTQGCVADGLLSGYNKPKVDIPLARESNCYYFHRALETWRSVPDFQKAHETITAIGRTDVLYGMFIAEAIDTKSDYYNRAANRSFDFEDMCKKGSKNYWGEHTCKPSLATEEYRAYLKQITRDAMDSGIQVFLFGQIRHQEENINHPKIDNVIRDMRAYAKSKNMAIVIGAQTGDITNKKYVGFFDFIDGGIGLHSDGSIENGPCFSRWWQQDGDWCWPLMWHKDYTSRAKNVFVYLDWNGEVGDDMSTFTRMDAELRHETLRKLHTALPAKGVGFLLPLITPLPKNNDGCHGPRKSFYSPAMGDGCADMDVIDELLHAAEPTRY